VYSGVLLERAVLSKGLVAIFALEGSVFVVGSFVLFQTFFAIEKFVATNDRTFKKHLSFSILKVFKIMIIN
jgi:hypothetical protein